jgi:thiol-disulfide isomerase/thioredoxin
MRTPLRRPLHSILLPALAIAASCAVARLSAAESAAPAAEQTAPKSEADKEHDALWAGYREKMPEGVDPKKREYWERTDRRLSRFAEQGLAFFKNHPEDPRRWEAVVQMGYTAPIYLKGFKDGFDEDPGYANVELDQEAAAGFLRLHAPRMAEVAAADGPSDRQRFGAYQWLCIQAARAAGGPDAKPDLSELAPLTEKLLAKFPDETGATIAGIYIDFLKRADPAAADAFSAKIKPTPVGAAMVAKMDREEAEKKRIEELREAEIGRIKFTAVDGTEVDLAKMRGKVVLIDFWATWCGPCVAEIPNVVANYKKYHAQGFEVVGITLESDPDDKKKMVDYTEKHEMVWPQYFDGKGWDNDLGRKFGIRAIPAMFLLDKEGKIASSNARGEQLETEIKRLLGL